MSVVVRIKNADFSENCIGTLSRWDEVLSVNKSANEGEVTTSTSSTQTRIWVQLPTPSIPGRMYKASLSVTNGSGVASGTFTDLCVIRFVADNTARTGQEIIPIVQTSSIPDLTSYSVENEVTCNATYNYVYININWDVNLPTKYPNIELTLSIYQ